MTCETVGAAENGVMRGRRLALVVGTCQAVVTGLVGHDPLKVLCVLFTLMKSVLFLPVFKCHRHLLLLDVQNRHAAYQALTHALMRLPSLGVKVVRCLRAVQMVKSLIKL